MAAPMRMAGAWVACALFLCATAGRAETTAGVAAETTTGTAPVEASMSGGAEQAAFVSGNQAYRHQDYPAAAGWYQALIEEGVRSPELFYNRGNTAAQLGSTGDAVLNYSRALDLAPRDADLRANMARVVPPGEPLEPPDAFGAAGRLVRRATVGEWLALFGVFHIAACAFASGWLMRRGAVPGVWLRRAAAAFGAVALLLAVPAGIRLHQHRNISHVVVLAARAPVHSGPGAGFSQIGHAVEGSRLQRLRFGADAGWVRVELPDGLRGFMEADKVAVLRGGGR